MVPSGVMRAKGKEHRVGVRGQGRGDGHLAVPKGVGSGVRVETRKGRVVLSGAAGQGEGEKTGAVGAGISSHCRDGGGGMGFV